MGLKRRSFDAVCRDVRDPVDEETLATAAQIVSAVRAGGVDAVRTYAERFGDVAVGAPLLVMPDKLNAALARISAEDRAVLERTTERIAAFALAQRASLRDLDVPILGGRAGHVVRPVKVAGCYAPGGRFPLPSSVLMTAVTARFAGVETVWVASPRPTDHTLAAAAIAGVDGLLCVGGAQAIAAFAYGAGVPACDVVVGPGNRFVTAAKQLVSGRVRIDMLAGPSELLVLADEGANAALVDADLLAQAEHDPDAVPMLVSLDDGLVDAVNDEIRRQLEDLPTEETARAALRNGFAVVAPDMDAAIALCDRLAPEHLEVHTAGAQAVAERLTNYGGLFIGAGSAEVFGDYGAGPNHTLPTGGTGRFCGGLSVFDFLAVRTWMRLDTTSSELVADATALGRIEGLEAHARAAERR